MVLQTNGQHRIEDPRNYGPDVVNDLRNLMTAGVLAQLDPRRENFYALENGDSTFYIHISPINGHVMLLAKWLNSSRETGVPTAHVAA
jgi:hypothetical protein